MAELTNEERLLQCFQAVFPDADDTALRTASVTTITDWDSVAQVTLISVFEEEFGLTVTPERYEMLTSFQVFLDAVP